MDLHIIFRGLCLFVPAKNGKHVDVLFPETSHHAPHDPDHVHHPLVAYKGLSSPHKLLKRALHFGGALGAGTGTIPAVIPHLLRAGEIANKKVPPGQLGGHPDAKVATHIRVPAPDDRVLGRLVWFHRMENGVPQCMRLTNEITFVYRDVNGGALKPHTMKLGDPADIDPLDEPQASTGVIEIRITHLPTSEPRVCGGDRAAHVPMYYDFLGAPNDDLFLDEKTGLAACKTVEDLWTPLCAPTDLAPAEAELAESEKEEESGTAFNCMLAQAQPQ
ncbi:MAG TPA: hypothetical protein VF142_04165 [Longimicrobium sp.]